MGRQGYPGEASKEDWCRAGNGAIGPLTLGLHFQVSAYLLERHLKLPAQHEPFQNLNWGDGEISTQQRLGFKLPEGVPNENPTNWYWWLARMVPDHAL